MRLKSPSARKTMVVLGLCASCFNAVAAPIIIDGLEYGRSGNAELGINATFGGGAVDTGALANTSTSLTYSGFVEILVSGTGQSAGTTFNDAFYLFETASGAPYTPPIHDGSFYQLSMDTAAIQGVSGIPTPSSQLAKQLIVFDVNAGVQATPAYVPTYRSDHSYNFVIDTSLTAGWQGVASALSFTVADGGYADNSGSFNLDIYQLNNVVAPVPEPEIYAMMGVGLGVMGWVARRKKRLRFRS